MASTATAPRPGSAPSTEITAANVARLGLAYTPGAARRSQPPGITGRGRRGALFHRNLRRGLCGRWGQRKAAVEVRSQDLVAQPGQDELRLRRQPRRRPCRRQDLLDRARWPVVRARRQDRDASCGRSRPPTPRAARPSPARRALSTARSSSARAARTSACAAMSPPTTRRPGSRRGASMSCRARPSRTGAMRPWRWPPRPGPPDSLPPPAAAAGGRGIR